MAENLDFEEIDQHALEDLNIEDNDPDQIIEDN
jgi:hypothetical protein